MEVKRHWENNAGGYGWAALALGVIALDVALPQTLSSFADKMLEHPNKAVKAVPWAIGGVVAGHVLNLIPQAIDPIQVGADYVFDRWMK